MDGESAEDFLDKIVPKRLAQDPFLAARVLGVFQIDLEGAGVWSVEMLGDALVQRGSASAPDACTIACSKKDFEGIISEPTSVWDLFMTGRLRLSDACSAARLLEAFFPGSIGSAMPGPLLKAALPDLLPAAGGES